MVCTVDNERLFLFAKVKNEESFNGQDYSARIPGFVKIFLLYSSVRIMKKIEQLYNTKRLSAIFF